MSNFLAKISKVLKPIGGKMDALVAVKLHHQEVSLAEMRYVNGRINVITLGSISLPRPVDFAAIHRSQEMIADAIRSLKAKLRLTAVDAAITIPGQPIQIRQFNLPYMNPKELAREAKDIAFWIENEPDLEKFDDPSLSYQVLVSSEDDDLIRLLLAFAERAQLQPWIDILLAAHLNPVFLESEALSLINLNYSTLPTEDQRQSQVMVQLDRQHCQCIAFERNRVHRLRLEISEFDLVLLEQAEETGPVEGEFWDEVTGRVAHVIRQAILYLQEEQDFQPPAKVYLVSEYPRCRHILPLLEKKVDLSRITLWNPLEKMDLCADAAAVAAACANPSRLSSCIGASLQKLGIYGEKNRVPFVVNSLPRHELLRRNRQFSILITTLSRGLAASILFLGIWTGGFVLPPYIQSERVSRDFQSLEFNAGQIEAQIDEATKALQKTAMEIEEMRSLQASYGKMEFLETLPDLLPDGAELSFLGIDEANEVHITGFALSGQAVAFFRQQLLESGFMDSISLDMTEESNLMGFTVTGRLRRLE